jgi:predicted metalloprotease with PDZ domain
VRVSALLLFLAALLVAQEPIRYTVRISAPQTNYIDVEAIVPTGGHPQVELAMAVWTPYVIREYAKNVEGVTARTTHGAWLSIEKSRKNRWRIETNGSNPVVVSYRVYCHVMNVQDNWVDSEFALLNGQATFLTLAGDTRRPHEVKLILPGGWKRSITAMPSVAHGGSHHYRAPDYETLVDSPIVAGNPTVYEFTVDGKRHLLVNVGEDGFWDGPRSVHDLTRMVREESRLWGGLPYEQYIFFNLLTEAGGGMEHANCSVFMASRWAMQNQQRYRRWLDVASHEYFHAWNVKRLRPAEFVPGEYETEEYTRDLGIAEGFTNYYAALELTRAGLFDEDELLSTVSHYIGQLQTTPGRLVQSLAMSSFDTWIKFYRPDENTVNTAISYYEKGAVVGFLLDAEIRQATENRKSLDDVMRLALERYPAERGYTLRDFRGIVLEVAGADAASWFDAAFEGTAELKYDNALRWFGLQFADAPHRGRGAWLGAVTKVDGQRLMVSQIPRKTPAAEAGLNAGDEVVAIGEHKIRADQWEGELANHHSGEKTSLLIARRGRVMKLEVTFGKIPAESWELLANPDAPREALAHRAEWDRTRSQ